MDEVFPYLDFNFFQPCFLVSSVRVLNFLVKSNYQHFILFSAIINRVVCLKSGFGFSLLVHGYRTGVM